MVAERVARARERAAGRGVRSNAEIPGSALDELAPISDAAQDRLRGVLRAGGLSARGLSRVWRVVWMLADLDGHDGPVTGHQIGLALQLRADVTGVQGLVA